MASSALAEAVAPVVGDIIMTRCEMDFDLEAARRCQNHQNVGTFPQIGDLHPSWYVINQLSQNETEIRIYEDIGLFGVTAKAFADELEQVEAQTLHVRLNTYGGEVFDGIAIYNSLRAHPATVIVHVDGIAASAGSIIAMSGNEIRMANNAFMMIHEARGGVMGEAGDMRQYAEMLDKLNDSIAGTYQIRAGKTRKYWREKMAVETWFTAEEAKAERLADAIDGAQKTAKNRFDFKVYNQVQHVPETVLKTWGLPAQQAKPEPTPDVSPRGDQAAPLEKEITPMSETNAPAAPASPAVVVTNQSAQAPPTITDAETRRQELVNLNARALDATKEQGRAAGIAEGRKLELDRAKAIADACPGKPDMALSAILAGQPAESVAMAFAAATAAEAKAKTEADAKDAEIARWRALCAIGGYPGGVTMDTTSDGDGQPGLDPKVQAEQEWDHKPAVRKGFSSKERYIAVRTAELNGQFRREKAQIGD